MNKYLSWWARIAALLLLIPLLAACGSDPTATPPAPTATPPPPPTATAAPTATIPPELAAAILNTQGATTPIHDPVMIKDGDTYYIFSTGTGIPIHCSKDMLQWNDCGRVFSSLPTWIAAAVPGVGDLWAPDISFHDGKFSLYYSASTFGSNHSAIGLATTPTLNRDSPDYAWTDQGQVIASDTPDKYNTIDPNLAYDTSGQPWLAFGSFWSGIQLVKVDPSTGKPAADAELSNIANHPGSDAIEGAYIVHRGDYYYLFVSFDYCCKGVMSSYNIRVGRSKEITGPYADKDGKPMIGGGATVVYKGSARWRGPGHNAIYIEGDTYYMLYHSYDANYGGAPTLRIEKLSWDADGWPISPSAAAGQ